MLRSNRCGPHVLIGCRQRAGVTAADDDLRFFPYETPYPNQREAIDRIANSLGQARDVLFEGAPGTGKTLSALVPALAYARDNDKTVVITTNVHQQMRQFVDDARAITRTKPIRAVVFKGKAEMCHIDVGYQECQTLRDTTRELVDTETDHEELAARQEELLEASQEGESGAAEARSAVMDELDDLEDELDELRGGNVCDYYYNNLTADTDDFFGWLFDDVRTPEEIYEYADQQGLCGYELLKEGMENIDLVVCNYHHLLDPMIREQFFRWLDCDPSDVITVFDEAHNIEGAARDHATKTLTENTLESALEELAGVEDSLAEPARNVIEAFRDALIVTYEDELTDYERDNVGDHWADVSVANPDARDEITLAFLRLYEGRGIDTETELAVQLGRTLDEEYERAYKEGEATSRAECQTLQAAQFISTWMDEGGELGQHSMAGVRRNDQTGDVYGRAELYTCIPREVTRDLFDDVYASVLMSATLRPFDVTEDVLGLDSPATMAYGLAYPEENRRTYAAEVPALFASERDDPATQETITNLLRDVIRFTPGNTLLFCPSYAEAERYHGRLSVENRADEPLGTLMLDESGKSTEDLRQQFVTSDDATLFTSLWGTLAEGVSFDGDEARTVVVIGVPYPQLSERMEAVQDAYERAYSGTHQKRDAGWAYAVEIPTIRKTRQALGRVIRSPEDFGVRILADKRYTNADMGKYSVRRSFPVAEREELVDLSPEKLKFAMLNFYTDHDAYNGMPPEP